MNLLFLRIIPSSKLTIYFIAFVPLLVSCKMGHYAMRKNIHEIVKESSVFEKNFTGLMLYDPANKQTVYENNAHKYFNPASNTKLFTFYAALNILGDSIPALEYMVRGDSLIFKGTGDPSFLNKDLNYNTRIFDFLKNSEKGLYYAPQSSTERRYGPGWAWDDFNDYYATEKAAFPIYGNVAQFVFTEDSIAPTVVPSFFSWSLFRQEDNKNGLANANFLQRDEYENTFYYGESKDPSKTTRIVPFKYTQDLFVRLLSDTLEKPVYMLPEPLVFDNSKTLYSLPADSVYKRMLQDSDNFLAEQLLMLCAGIISDTLESGLAIDYIKSTLLKDLPDEAHWVDGSGLSRYNLFTPRSIVMLLDKILEIVPQERLFSLLATGGKSGNLKDYFKEEKPFIFAKTGTLSNNYCLSGFMLTKSGKLLVFSFMNNNYIIPEKVIKNEVALIIRNIYENY